MDPLQWMGAVRMRVQTADKNITVIHTTPVHQLMSCEAKSCVFVNKSIKTFLTSNYCFWPKYEFIIHNNFSSSEKVHLLLSSNIKIHPHICLELFWTVLACKRCLICADISPDSDQTTFSLEETILWTHILAGSDGLKLKTSRWICFLQTHCFSLHKMLTDGLEWCGWSNTCELLWCFYQMFGLSFWAEQVMEYNWNAFLQICFHEETNLSTSWMAWGWVHFQQI